MKFPSHVFRAYDIRGRYPSEIDERFAELLGRAFGSLGFDRVCVGGDVRLSTPPLKGGLIEGLVASGCEVIDIGISSTPMLIFAIKKLKADGGIIATASHLPAEFNGFLLYDSRGFGISYEKGIEELRRMMEKEKFRQGEGKVEEIDVKEEYLRYLIEQSKIDCIELKVVVDAGNGVAGLLAPKLLRRVGADVVELFCEPDGRFPNRKPEPVEEELDALKKKVVREKAAVGVAYDCDVDRIIAVDENGYALKPHQLFGILIKQALSEGRGRIVHDVLASSAIIELIKQLGGEPVKSRVGHVYVQEKCAQVDALMAGEISGHYFYREIGWADDALFATLKLLSYLKDKSLSGCYADIPSYPFAHFRIPIEEERKSEFIEELKEEFKEKYEVDCFEGVKVVLPRAWALFRASQTEAKISIAYEGKDEESFREIEEIVKRVVDKLLG